MTCRCVSCPWCGSIPDRQGKQALFHQLARLELDDLALRDAHHVGGLVGIAADPGTAHGHFENAEITELDVPARQQGLGYVIQ